MNFSTAFNRVRISRSLLSIVFSRSRISNLSAAVVAISLLSVPAPAIAAPACAPASSVAVDIYTVVTFTSRTACDWTVPSQVSSIDVFMVGAGGGGGGDGGGGGGGGAAISRTAFAVTAGSALTLTVGTGGNPSVWTTGYAGTDGSATSLVRPSPATTLIANAGLKGGLGPSGVVGTGGSAVNGGFAGGRGGNNSGSGNTKGGDGFTGVSNYFTGTKIEYGGGGGGGSYYGANSFTGALGKSGGGDSGAAGSGINQPGNPGRANSGGGGGGGSAGSPQTAGGQGADGVIIIRYATSSLDAFPASVASALVKRFVPGDLQTLDATRKSWIDSSGQTPSIANGNFRGTPTITTQGTSDTGNTVGSSKSILTAAGTVNDGVTLSDLPSNYTLFHVARYQRGGSQARIIAGTSLNWLSGFWGGQQGVAFHNTRLFMTPQPTTDYTWQLSTDKLNTYRSNGKDTTLNVDAFDAPSTATGFGINVGWSGAEYSTWQVADLLVFDRELTNGETRLVELYLSRIYGLTLDSGYATSETDTALSFNGGQYLYSQKSVANYLNDTFTVEAWVNPGTECSASGSGSCGIFNRENVLVTRIASGTFWYALYGTNSAWDWINSGVQVPSNQWSHIAITKRGIANTANSLDVLLNGQLAWTKPGNPYRPGTATYSASDVVYQENNQWTYIGARGGTADRFYGNMDEIKVWKAARTTAQVATDMHSNDASSLLMQIYWDFNKNSLSNTEQVINLAYGGPNRADLVAATTIPYVDVKTVSSVSPYTTISFPRTYITQVGGWKVPNGVARVSALVVAGGGGGGSRHGGGGGGGGVSYAPAYSLNSGATFEIVVGAGGIGYGQPGNSPYVDGNGAFVASADGNANGTGTSGGYSTLRPSNVLESITALGGGGGGGVGLSGGSGGGSNGSFVSAGGSSKYSTQFFTSYGNVGGVGYSGNECGTDYCGGGGGGAGSAGETPTVSGLSATDRAGNGGNGFALANGALTPTYYGGGGGGGAFNAGLDSIGGLGGGGAGGKNAQGTTGTYALGGGGGGGGFSGNTSYRGGNGGSGVVIIRWITAAKPTYTKPTNAFLNVGMTETFTTNVLLDSATAGLTRTFTWESSTAGAGGPFTRIKSGTGAANAAFSWVPTDTSTSGSNYLYRLTVTDSDTAGLFITDSSTAFAVINPALRVAGISAIPKAINLSKSETFTITLGTSTYRPTLSPVIPGITLDTSTAGLAIVRLSDTLTVGTYYETLTVVDSVSASVVLPLVIRVLAPPQLTNTGEIVADGQVFNLDFSNSASYSPLSQAIADISGAKKTITAPNGGTYSNDFSGIYTLSSASSQYLTATAFSMLPKWTIETYIRINQTPTAQFCPFASEYASSSISMLLCVDAARTVFTGFFDRIGGVDKWSFKRSQEVIPLNTWVHIVGTFDGSAANLYFDGVSTTRNSGDGGRYDAGYVPPTPNTNRVFIGKDYPTAVGTTPNISLGFVRAFSSGLTQTQVQQNFNATRTRFETVNQSQIKPSQKYGTLTLESFTATSGSDTKTVTFAVGNRTGITWDTSTAGRVNLSVLSSLPVGPYYDTVTVTDNLGQSTYLPLRFTVTKADTITVTTTLSSNSLTYTELPANVTVTQTVTGLVNSETATVTTTYTETTPCASGGACKIGDVAPGGGKVFYISATDINSAPGISTGGKYLATAPNDWATLAGIPTFNNQFGCYSQPFTGSTDTIGSGAANTRIIVATGCTGGAITVANVTFNGYSDWFIPSLEELKIMYTNLYAPALASRNPSNARFWSSIPNPANTSESYIHNSDGTSGTTSRGNAGNQGIYFMPIRAFTPENSGNSLPTDAGTYRVGSTFALSSPAVLSNYQGVESVTATLTINKARQKAISIGQYEAYPNISSYPLNVYGGSGPGVVSRTLVAAGTANCSIVLNLVITATSVGSCTVKAEKAGTRNYFVESTTAVITWITWSANNALQSLGGNHAIPLSGGNQVIIKTETVTASAFSNTSGNPISSATVGTTIRINSSGFAGLTPAQITATFRPYEDGVVTAVTSTYVELVVPAGAVTGVIALDSPRGVAYTPSFTISP